MQTPVSESGKHSQKGVLCKWGDELFREKNVDRILWGKKICQKAPSGQDQSMRDWTKAFNAKITHTSMHWNKQHNITRIGRSPQANSKMHTLCQNEKEKFASKKRKKTTWNNWNTCNSYLKQLHSHVRFRLKTDVDTWRQMDPQDSTCERYGSLRSLVMSGTFITIGFVPMT